MRPAENPSVPFLDSSSETKRRHRISLCVKIDRTNIGQKTVKFWTRNKGKSHTRKLFLKQKSTLRFFTHLDRNPDKIRRLKPCTITKGDFSQFLELLLNFSRILCEQVLVFMLQPEVIFISGIFNFLGEVFFVPVLAKSKMLCEN